MAAICDWERHSGHPHSYFPTHSLTHSLTYSLTHLLTHSLTHSCCRPAVPTWGVLGVADVDGAEESLAHSLLRAVLKRHSLTH